MVFKWSRYTECCDKKDHRQRSIPLLTAGKSGRAEVGPAILRMQGMDQSDSDIDDASSDEDEVTDDDANAGANADAGQNDDDDDDDDDVEEIPQTQPTE